MIKSDKVKKLEKCLNNIEKLYNIPDDIINEGWGVAIL